MSHNKKAINTRSLTAFIVTWAFVVAMVTGTVLYIVPQGRVAYWVDWQLIGLDKTGWGNIHIIFGAIFIAAGLLHLYFNWKPFKKYLAERAAGHIHVRKEVVISTVVTALVMAGAIADLPPISWVYDLNETVKASWVEEADYEPPYGHAEESSLASLARRTRLDLDKAEAELRAQGIEFAGPRDTLEKIARLNDTNAMNIYRLIKKFEQTPKPMGSGDYTANAVEARFEGTGVGRKLLSDVCETTGIGLEKARNRLAHAAIEMEDEMTIRQIADLHDTTPIEVLKIVLVSGYELAK